MTNASPVRRTGASGSRPPLPAHALADIAARLAADPATRAPAGTGRRWRRVVATDRYEAWVIAWPHGTGLALHDHAGSAAGVAMVAGRLRERYLVDAAVRTRWWTTGEALALATDHAHEVSSIGGDEAVSVHVYSPPLGDVRFRQEQAIRPMAGLATP